MLTALLLTLAQNAPGASGGGGTGNLVAWAAALFAIGIALFGVEIFVPSGGLLAVLSAASLLGGVALMFWEDTALGLITLLAVMLALPFALGFMIKIMPSTPFIRAITLGDPDTPDDDADDADGPPTPDALPTHPLLGKTGTAVTHLRPVGTVLIDGKRHECLAVGGLVEPGKPVQVVAVDGMQVKVRAA